MRRGGGGGRLQGAAGQRGARLLGPLQLMPPMYLTCIHNSRLNGRTHALTIIHCHVNCLWAAGQRRRLDVHWPHAAARRPGRHLHAGGPFHRFADSHTRMCML